MKKRPSGPGGFVMLWSLVYDRAPELPLAMADRSDY
jgi:hypothetical protein